MITTFSTKQQFAKETSVKSPACIDLIKLLPRRKLVCIDASLVGCYISHHA